MKKKRLYYESIPPKNSRKNEIISIIIGGVLTLALMAVVFYGIYNLIVAL